MIILTVVCSAVTILVIFSKELVVIATDDQCTEYQFKAPFFPGDSCEDIYNMNQESQNRSGYYWIIDSDGPSHVYCGMSYTGSSCENIYSNNLETGEHSGYYRINDTQWTYCNMTAIAATGNFISTCAGVEGRWRRIVNIDISAGDDCPGEWMKANQSGISFCRIASDDFRSCSSASFTTEGISYHRVCGRARGYQKGHPQCFYRSNALGSSLETSYVAGLSITYGSPRKHIWTYATGRYDHHDVDAEAAFSCPCSNGGLIDSAPPSYVGTNYYCESGTDNRVNANTYYFNDVLWDGSGCITSNCCNMSTTQPWFHHQLNANTSDNIEARICTISRFNLASTLIDQLEIYIQ